MADLDIKIRKYRSGDEIQIVELLDLVFQGWPRFDIKCTALEHWRWKYLDYSNKYNTTVVAEHNGTIIGVDHNIYVNAKVFKKIILCSQGTDSAIHPDYQGKRIYSRILEIKNKIRKGFDLFSYWISSNPILIESAKKKSRPYFKDPYIEYIFVNDVEIHFKHRPDSILMRTLKKGYIMAFKLHNKFKKNNIVEDNYMVISEITSFDSRFTDFWYSIKDGYEFIVERNQEYLNWRYADYRGGEYIIKSVLNDDIIIGYIVLRINRFNVDYPEGYIVEFYNLPGKKNIRELLISEAIQFFNEHNINIIHAFAFKSSKDASLLRNFGFVSSRNDSYVFINPLYFSGNLEELVKKHPDTISFNYGTSDWI